MSKYREIKFRAKTLYEVKWIYGSLVHNEDGYAIYQNRFPEPVKPETLGQFTGLQLNGEDLYEGDIIGEYEQFDSMNENRYWLRNTYTCVHGLDRKYPGFLIKGLEWDINPIQEIALNPEDYWEYFKIIGNIHDSPELADKRDMHEVDMYDWIADKIREIEKRD